ncbi:MAG: BlaI/MecI/CopY family transcriptional regulator [Cyanobacteria bacterium P01_H01_bin.119]
MAPLPEHTPKRLSLGSLETEILQLLWQFGTTTAKAIHTEILADPDRELAYASVTTVLNRLAQKGWVKAHKKGRSFYWEALVSEKNAQILNAHDRLQQFLAVGNPDIVAAFADSLDSRSLEQIEAIAERIRAVRAQRGDDLCI